MQSVHAFLWHPRMHIGLLNLYLAGLVSLILLLQSSPASATDYQRIVSLSPQLTKNVFLLGKGKQLVGNTIYCNTPAAAQRKSKIGSVLEPSIEKIAALHPDLILADPLNPQAQLDLLKQLHFTVEVFKQPHSFTEICDQFLRIGNLLQRQQQAQTIVRQAQQRVTRIQQSVQTLTRPRVLLQVGIHPLFSSVSNSFTHDFIRLGGGRNVVANRQSGAVTLEEIVALNPDIILIALMGTQQGVGAEAKKQWESFPALTAVRNDHIYLVDPEKICSPSPLTFATMLETIAGLIHPEMR